MELARIRQHWIDLLPTDEHGDTGDMLQWALAQDTATLLDLLAYLVAASVQGVNSQESNVSKDRILTAVTDGAGETAAVPLVKMKKKPDRRSGRGNLARTGLVAGGAAHPGQLKVVGRILRVAARCARRYVHASARTGWLLQNLSY